MAFAPPRNGRFPRLLALACSLPIVSLRVWAVEPLYVQTAQQRSMEVDARYKAGALPEQFDARSESSAALGDFDRIITASANVETDADPDYYAFSLATASGKVTYAPDAIFGRIASLLQIEGQNAEAGGNVKSSFSTHFTVRPGPNLPYSLTGPTRGAGLRYVRLVDEDTEDPHGGGTTIYGGATDGVLEDWNLQGSGVLLGGHRYSLYIETAAAIEILNNPPPPSFFDYDHFGEVNFTLALPEPSLGVLLAGLVVVACGRRGR